jgi:hypothetical protein
MRSSRSPGVQGEEPGVTSQEPGGARGVWTSRAIQNLWALLADATYGTYETYVSAPICPMSPIGPIRPRSPQVLDGAGSSIYRVPPS